MIQLLNGSPKSVAVVFLLLDLDWIFDDTDAPLLFEVRTFPKDFFLKLGRVTVLFHLQLNLGLVVYSAITFLYCKLTVTLPLGSG